MNAEKKRTHYDTFERRVYLVALAIGLSLCVLGLRLWYLQVARYEYYRQQAEYNRLHAQRLEAPRGIIYGRDESVVLADNRPSCDLVIVPAECMADNLEVVCRRLENLINIDADDLLKRIEQNRKRPYGPLIRAFAEKFGEDAVCRLVRCVMGDISYKLGREKAARVGRGLENLKKQCIAEWNKCGELEEEVIEDSDVTLRFNVTRCAFAELYKELGYQDIGALISCDRDFSFIEGFDPDIELIRTGTIMNGDSLCDFCYRKKEARER